jgi:hypothetical protein
LGLGTGWEVYSMVYMQEALAHPGENQKPLKEQGYWVLELMDFTEGCPPHFVVQQSRIRWSDVDGCMMASGRAGDHVQVATLEGAKKIYEARRARLVRKGFTESDMEF